MNEQNKHRVLAVVCWILSGVLALVVWPVAIITFLLAIGFSAKSMDASEGGRPWYMKPVWQLWRERNQ